MNISPENQHSLLEDATTSSTTVPKEQTPQTLFGNIVDEVISKRTLLVLSKGMRSPSLMAHLIAAHMKGKENSLTLLLNFKKEEIPAINEQLESLKLGKYKIKQITSETIVKRTGLYVSGGIYTVTNVILVMDLLQRAISPSIITALIVNEAEKIDSILDDEAWIATMIRKENKNLKTLAITDAIELLTPNQGFRKVMQALFLEYCSVWPLSRYEILKDVTEHPDFHTYESHIKLPGPIKRLQKAVMNVIRSCIEEFNRRFKEKNKGEDVLNENDVFNTSVQVVYYRMKAIANRYNLRGQQLLRDIFEFRMLLLNLLYFDAVEFYQKILNLRNSANFESIWYIGDRRTMEHIEDLLKFSKQRVFKLKREFSSNDKPSKKESATEESNPFDIDLEDGSKSMSMSNLQGLDDLDIGGKGEEGETAYLDVVKNPVSYKKQNYRLDLKININFKYKALVEVLKNLTSQQANGGSEKSAGNKEKKKIIWIWAQEEKKVGKIKDILTSFFSKKDDHKIKLLLRLHYLLEDMGIDKKERPQNPDEEEQFEEPELYRKEKMKTKANEANAETFIFKKLHEDLINIKKEYDNKVMINLFNSGNSKDSLSQSQSLPVPTQSEETCGAQLIQLLKPKKKLKRRFYDVDDGEKDEEEEEQKQKEQKSEEASLQNKMPSLDDEKTVGLDDVPLLEGKKPEEEDFGDGVQTFKKVLTNEENERMKKKYEYSILNPDKIDLNSFYSYNDSGHVIFDSELIPGYKVVVNSLQSTSERVSFINKTEPDIAILFEPQLSLIREVMLEKRCAKYGGKKCSINEVHILMVQNSIESAIYLDNVRRENSAFVTLLNERSSLPILDDNPESRIKRIIYQKNVSTRIGRGLGHAINLNNRPIIIVDKREFNSPVPAKLFHDGFWVIPILLEKGDYVLSNTLVVERKAVDTGDLLNSLRSGRLENQISNMCKSFSRPMLLIEFSEGVDFSLESAEISRLQHNINWVNNFEANKTEINKSNVKFMLALLCMKYPKITILWSKSPEYTSKLFQRLREENPDPDPRLFAKFQEESEKNNDSDPFARHMKENEEGKELGES